MKKSNFFVLVLIVVLSGVCCAVRQSGKTDVLDTNSGRDGVVLEQHDKSRDNNAQCEPPFWTGDVGGKRLVWDSEEIYIDSKAVRVPMFQPSFKVLHKYRNGQIKKFLKENMQDFKYSESETVKVFHNMADISLKSVVGDIVSFEIEYGDILEGSPASHKVWWLTLNMSKFRKYEPFLVEDIENTDVVNSVRLTDIFNSSDIIKELQKKQSITEYLTSQQIKDIKGFLNTMLNEKQSISVPRLQIDRNANFLTPYSFEHFIFDRIENNNVAVKIALVNFSQTENYRVEYLEIELPIPNAYLNRFERSRDGIEGFLASNKMAASGCTTKLRMTSQLAEE